MKLIELINMQTPIQQILDQKIPFGLAYKFTTIARAIDVNSKFYTENLQKLLTEYAQVDENGQFKHTKDGSGILIKPELLDEFNSKITELQEIEITDSIPTFKLADLEDKVEISPRDLYALMELIEE